MNELVLIENNKLEESFKPGGLDYLIHKIKREVSDFVPDIGTAKGRAGLKSIAFKISRSKTYLDNVGKEYVAQLKKIPVQVDAERKRMRMELDGLKEEVRKPLTIWETEEALRIEAEKLQAQIKKDHAQAIQDNILFDEKKRIEAREMEIAKKEAEYQERQEAEQAEKDKIEREKKIAFDAIENERKEASEKAKKEQQEAEKRIWQLEENSRKEKEESARRVWEAQEKANEAERAKVEAIEREKEIAKQEAILIEEERITKERREKEEEQERISNETHRNNVLAEAASSLMECLVCESEEQANQIVKAIDDSLVKNVSINY